MKNFAKVLSLALVVVMLASLVVSCTTASNQAPKLKTTFVKSLGDSSISVDDFTPADPDALAGQTINIGIIGSLTGAVAQYGTSAIQGMELAIKEINASSEKVLGATISYTRYDDQFTDANAIAKFEEFAEDGVSAVLGGITSGLTKSLVNKAMEYKLPLLTPTATSDDVTSLENDWVFRTCFSDSFQGEIAALYAQSLGYKEVGVLYATGDVYSSGLYQAFKTKCEELGITIKVTVTTAAATEVEYKTQLTEVVNSGVEFLFVPYYYDVVGPNIIPQARAYGYDGIIMGGDGFDGTATTAVGKASDYENVYFTNHYSADDTSEKVQHFVSAYTKEYGAESLSSFAALGYDTAYMFKKAVEMAGSADSAAIQAVLANSETPFGFSGVTGAFLLDETGTPNKSVVILKFDKAE